MDYLEKKSIRTSYFNGSRRLSNIIWATLVFLGGIGFFFSGLTSFLKTNLLFFLHFSDISFIPQGIILLFYGTVGCLLGIFITLTIYWNIGSGYNEYNRDLKEITLYRTGFPGKYKELRITFSFNEIESIKMRIKEGINPERQLLACLTDRREIPLIGIQQPMAFSKIEEEAIKLSHYLNVYLETE